MQETRNNCFVSKKRCTTLHQMKTSKHECLNLTATYIALILCYTRCLVFCYYITLYTLLSRFLLYFSTHAYLFLPDHGLCYVFSIQNNCWVFLASYVLFLKVIFNHASKRQFVVLHYHIRCTFVSSIYTAKNLTTRHYEIKLPKTVKI